MSEFVLPEYRPTLRDELVRRPRLRPPVIALAVLVVLGAAGIAWRVRHTGIEVSGKTPVAFHFRRPAVLHPRRPLAGELVRLEQSRRGRVLNEFVVSPLRLPPYTGDPAGVLAVLAQRELIALRARYPTLELVSEGSARFAGMPGQELRFRIPGKHRLFGREMLLPRPVHGARDGVRLLAIAQASADVGGAGAVGVHGATRLPYRTFRFG